MTSPPATATAVLRGDRAEAVGELEQLRLVAVLGDPELDVGLARGGAHRREVRERDRERLVADVGER